MFAGRCKHMIDTLIRKFQGFTADQRFSEILTGSSYALVARIAATGVALITNIIVARIYGAEVLGILAVINSFILLTSVFTVFGTNTAILRLIPEHITRYSVASAYNVYRKTQYFVAGLAVMIGILMFFSSNILAVRIFAKPELAFFFAMASCFIIFSSLIDLNTQAVRGLRLIRTFAFMQILPTITTLLVLVLLTVSHDNKYNPIYAQFAAWSITAAAGVWIMNVAFRKRILRGVSVHPVPLRNVISMSLPMLMTSAFVFVIGETGTIMVGIYRAASEVGYYSAAVKLAMLTTFVLQAINSMAAPKFSELYHQNKMDELFHIAKKSTKMIFWVTTPILLCLVILGKPILTLLFGVKFLAAFEPLVFLAIGQFINAISGSTGIFMNMTGNHKAFRNIVAVAAVINIILNLMLIPRYGITGAAIAGMVSLGFWNIFTLLFIKSRFGTSIGYLPTFR